MEFTTYTTILISRRLFKSQHLVRNFSHCHSNIFKERCYEKRLTAPTNICLQNLYLELRLRHPLPIQSLKRFSTKKSDGPETKTPEDNISQPPEKQNVFKRLKQLTKEYWHILIPVHLVTSIGWVTVFFIAAKNGVDVVPILEYLQINEKFINMIRNSSASDWLMTYALYKLFTPIRYTVTVGGTTLSIRYLNKWGYLKYKPGTITEFLSRHSKLFRKYFGKENPSQKPGL